MSEFTETCEHKTSAVEYTSAPWQINRCEWGWGQYLVTYTDVTGLTHIIAEWSHQTGGEGWRAVLKLTHIS